MGVFSRATGPARVLERCRATAGRVEALGPKARNLSDEELRAAYAVLRGRHAGGESLDDLLPETYALVREAAFRALGQRPYDEQIIGAVALHLGMLVEMKTGEGKTLTAVLPACLHALAAGSRVHVMTANDHLVARDAAWMAPVYGALGLTCQTLAVNATGDAPDAANEADVLYGTPSAFAYGYLRRNLVVGEGRQVPRPLASAIVDEADLLLLDEAVLTPMITGPKQPAEDRERPRALAGRMRAGHHYTVDESQGTVVLTAQGFAWLTDQLGAEPASTEEGLGLLRRLDDALRAKELFVRDRDYVVQDGGIQVIDPQTRRPVPDRSAGEGLDRALDAKEGLPVRAERPLLAIVSQHAYLKLYPRLAGLTGVVDGDQDAYRDGYGLDCLEVPTHRPVLREDHDPVVYATDAAMLRAVVRAVRRKRREGRPVLVGTTTERRTREVSGLLAEAGVPHEVFDAVGLERAAELAAAAGRPGAVTVLTRMAGRGVDLAADAGAEGGLFVLGVGPMGSRRLELHLRGRTGRGGTAGETAFFLSLDDPVFAGTSARRAASMVPDDTPLDGRMITRILTRTMLALSADQTRRRSASLKHAQVRDEISAAFYARRVRVQETGVPDAEAEPLLAQTVQAWARRVRDASGARNALGDIFPTSLADAVIDAGLAAAPASAERDRLVEALTADATRAYRARVAQLESDASADVTEELKRRIMVTLMDKHWFEFLRDLADAEAGVQLRTVAGGDALTEYHLAGRRLAERMERRVREEFFGYFFRVRVEVPSDPGSPSGP